MAIIKTVSPKIKSGAHLKEAVEYVTSKESKLNKKEKAYKISYNLCSKTKPDELVKDWNNTRMLNNRGDILAVHLVQSFSPNDNITPEQAHQIGLKLMQKCFPQYQVVIATHIDADHIHNHFLINSVSPLDGKKFQDNLKKINLIKKESDRLCYQNNLNVIEKDNVTKYRPLDQATLNAAQRGKSWKVQLVKDLDVALEKCKSKNDFVNFFEENNYEIKWTDKNITLKKNGEAKGIRLDTLAKSFGAKYSKANVEKKLNISQKPTPNPNQTKLKNNYVDNSYYNRLAAEEWKRYEEKYKNKIKFNRSNRGYFSQVLFAKSPTVFVLRLINVLFKNSKKQNYHNIKTVKRAKSKYIFKNGVHKIIGNIQYNTILNTPGDVAQLKLYAWQITKLLDNGILLSSKIDVQSGTGITTVKDFDLPKIANILNVSLESLKNQKAIISNRKTVYEFKKNNKELNYLVVTAEQVQQLQERCIKFAVYKKGDKFNIAYSSADKDKVLSAIYPNRAENINGDTFFKRNAVLNKQLKDKSAETGEQLCYKIVLSNQYKQLRKTNIEFAVFRTKTGKYNLVFLKHNENAINKALGLGGVSDEAAVVGGNNTIKNKKR